jgi:hypothetical protein
VTGGFSTRNLSIGEYRSLPIELTCTAFSFVSATNFLILSSSRGAASTEPGRVPAEPEFRSSRCTAHDGACGPRHPALLGPLVVDPAPLSTVHDYSTSGAACATRVFNVTTGPQLDRLREATRRTGRCRARST